MRLLKLTALLTPLVVAGVAWAGTVVGTPRADVLRGTPRNDKIYGKAGNDRLYGFGGNDVLVGGPGADVLSCGGGRDVAIADRRDKVRKDCEVAKGRPKPPPPTRREGLYIALGDSISEGLGASSPTRNWVKLYYNHMAASGSGLTRLENLAFRGHTTADLRTLRLPRAVSIINDPDDTLRVTVNIGVNDACPNPGDPSCPVAENLRAILTTINEALARDPGEETVQIMEYYNSQIGTPDEGARRAYLLGSDLRVDCGGTGSAVGLNDLIHCIGLEKGVLPVDVLPVFDTGGPSYLAADHSHPSDAGHRAIAQAFGGAAP